MLSRGGEMMGEEDRFENLCLEGYRSLGKISDDQLGKVVSYFCWSASSAIG
jgi:hypothetical protein